MRTLLRVLHQMLMSGKLTHEKFIFPKHQLFLNHSKVVFNKDGKLEPFSCQTQTLEIKKSTQDLSVKVLTPLLIKDRQSARPYKLKPTLEDLLISIYKRACFFEGEALSETLPYVPSYTLLSAHFEEVKTTRASYRQEQKVFLKGVVGEFVLTSLDPRSYALLKLGEILSAGNKTAFGHGIISLTV